METISIGSDLDRISDLPRNVIDLILCFLPFKDAVKTSALSKNWKEKWHTLPHVIIDEDMFHKNYFRKLEGVVNDVLAKHKGKIAKFSVFVEVKDYFHVKSWICRLRQKDIRELFLLYRRGNRHLNEVPSILFSCQQLRKLGLRHCVLKPPRSFQRFTCLISLELNKVELEIDAFEKLISSCPLLEQLILRKLVCVDHFQIDVPKLKYFCFDGEFVSMRFNTPFLEVLSINLYRVYRHENKQFDLRFKFWGLPSSIKELYVRCELQKYLAACDAFTEVATYSHLGTLGLENFCFEKEDDVLCLLSLIGTAVNLTMLDITACGCDIKAVSKPVTKFWEEQNNAPSVLNQLKKTRVRSFRGKHPEMKFIQYVMANAPALEEMTVEYVKDPKFDEDQVKGTLQLLCKASTHLKFIGESHHESNSMDADDHESNSMGRDAFRRSLTRRLFGHFSDDDDDEYNSMDDDY
ncbi:F-box/RNI-like/FBD-like domains-containing protein [Euphorbia peplus]|nr:F-box/RNI-like/FBD-like domains-containing protein [Euphorbia peplus]